LGKFELAHTGTLMLDELGEMSLEIQAKFLRVLEAKVLDDESIPLVGINAKTVNGVVTLSGDVKNRSSLTAILRRVSAIKGVKKIISDLQSLPRQEIT
jgi:transcriptional regulator of aromatic amino acid metabolism